MQTSILAVFVASLLGSLHCAGMCGGFAVACASNSQKPFTSAAYHFGRLCTYLLLGACAGALGRQIEQWSSARGLPQLVILLVSAVLILQGLFSLVPALRRRETRFGRGVAKIFEPVRAAVLKRVPRESAGFPLAVGLLSTLLPCPWLYSFVALAATTGSMLHGMLLMSVFWLGTLPLLLVFSGLTHILSPKLMRAAPVFSALLVLAAGFYSLSTHIRPHDHAHMQHQMHEGMSQGSAEVSSSATEHSQHQHGSHTAH